MSSRERRLLDKDIEIRKLQGELKHYKTCFFSCVLEKDRTRKALDVAKEGLKRIDWCATDYGVAQDILDEITSLEQKDK